MAVVWLLDITTIKTVPKGELAMLESLKFFFQRKQNGEHILIAARVSSGFCVNRLEEMCRNFNGHVRIMRLWIIFFFSL